MITREVKILGLATAFEDYDKNNIENLRLLFDKVQTDRRHFFNIKATNEYFEW